jgi:hypothetical protein
LLRFARVVHVFTMFLLQEDFENLFDADLFLCKAEPPAPIAAMLVNIKEPPDNAARSFSLHQQRRRERSDSGRGKG